MSISDASSSPFEIHINETPHVDTFPFAKPIERAKRNNRNNRLIHPAADWILLALAEGPARGGYISGQIVGDTVGGYVPGTTLYRLLRELTAGTIYRLTSRGRRRLLQQGSTWQRLSLLVKQRLR